MAMKRPSAADSAAGTTPAAVEAPKKTETARKVGKLPGKEDGESASRVQVAFRMSKDAYRDLKRMALDDDTTVNELIVRAINELRERRGLKKLS
jgi:hypothetical protein